MSAIDATPRSEVAARSTGATAAAYAYAIVLAAAVGHFLLGIPIQVTDCFGNMLKLATPWRELLIAEFTPRSYLRPFLWAELKLVYDASGGQFTPWFRGVHVAQIVALVVLYVALVRPRTWRDAAILPLGLAVLFGIHTFRGTVVEAFPVNTFLTVVLCCLAAANLALMAHRWWVDALALVLFAVAALTVESGLLVAVIFIAAALVGARGVSRPGLAFVVLALAGYFVLRFAILDVGSPALVERSSGYGFRILDPPDLIALFGESPVGFYAYNIATSAMSVLFAEPRAGVFWLVRGLVLGDPYRPAIVNVIASTGATLVIAGFAWKRRQAWRARTFDHDDRLVLLFAAVLAANATISYPYTKDVIMSPAGAFYAVAVFAAARSIIPSWPRSFAMRVAAGVACAVLGTAWSMRMLALPLNLRLAGFKTTNEWAYVDHWLADERIEVTDPSARALLRHLRNDAIYNRRPPPRLPIAEEQWLDVE